MRTNTLLPSRTAFASPDLVGLALTLAVAASLLLAATRQVRQEGMAASGLSQLQWMGAATGAYAADNGDRFWSYSWVAGPLPHTDPTLPQTASSDLIAARVQAVDILRRRTGRADLQMPPASLPHIAFNHLPLVDYLDRALPDFNLVSPADEDLLAWARDPAAFDAGAFLPRQPDPTDTGRRWPYSASYLTPPAMFDLSEAAADRISQHGTTHLAYSVPAAVRLGGARLADLAFVSQKVVAHDAQQRTGRRLYALAQDAQVVALCGDGSAQKTATRDTGPGWRPQNPTAPAPSLITYAPQPWEAPTASGEAAERVQGHFRWTRGGRLGRDLGGPEIDTGQ